MKKLPQKKILKTCNKGQNVIEYLLLVTVFVILLLSFLNTRNGPMKNALENILNDTVYDISTLQNELNME